MKKLISGILEFRKTQLQTYRKKFGHLASGQTPDALFFACSDSRVVPNLFVSTDPGSLFVVRNVGNLIPPCGKAGVSVGDKSEPAAIEFAVATLNVSDIIVCGHSECGAMRALLADHRKLELPNLRFWLSHARRALSMLDTESVGSGLSEHNRLSQINVLLQLQHLMTYEVVSERVASGKLTLHAWWFDIKTGDVHVFDRNSNSFVVIDQVG